MTNGDQKDSPSNLNFEELFCSDSVRGYTKIDFLLTTSIMLFFSLKIKHCWTYDVLFLFPVSMYCFLTLHQYNAEQHKPPVATKTIEFKMLQAEQTK